MSDIYSDMYIYILSCHVKRFPSTLSHHWSSALLHTFALAELESYEHVCTYLCHKTCNILFKCLMLNT